MVLITGLHWSWNRCKVLTDSAPSKQTNTTVAVSALHLPVRPAIDANKEGLCTRTRTKPSKTTLQEQDL